MTSLAVPEPGQLVEVRRRQWVVTDIQASAIMDDATSDPQHLIALASLDEDALDETLSVIWELEAGATTLDTAGLPKLDGYDSCSRLEAFLDAIRWGATTHADRSLLQSPFRSGIEIQDYQLDPLVRAIDMARVCLLIADDVGLGKTIEAGLVIQELIVRHRARTVLVVCPASLQRKWQIEMHEKFGLEFRVVDTDYIKRLRRERGIHANPWTSFPRLISSMDWMKSGEGLRLIKDVLPQHVTYPRKFDILVVDEAHNVAPSAASQYAMPSQRTRLIRTLAPHFEHRLFLSATPHNGYQESFTSLLELLDDQRFGRTMMPDEKQLQRVMVRRLKDDLVDENGDRIYPTRELEILSVEYTEQEREIHGLLDSFTKSRLESVHDTPSDFGTSFIHKLLKKRLFSSPLAFALTLAKHRQTLANGKNKGQKRSMQERILRKAIQRCEEDYADDLQVEEAEQQAVESATELSGAVTAEQADMLERLSAWAENAKNRRDSKADAILEWLDEHLKTDGMPNRKRVILFTEYRATHSWLTEILASSGWGGERLMTLHGKTDPDDRERIKAAFQADPDISPVRILLATDAASEGIDLQNFCNYLIHIEIPWNPNVMEQRNGRIDRHGQKEKAVFIWHPAGTGSTGMHEAVDKKPGDIEGDCEFLMRAVRKVNAIRQDLGCVGPVIAQQIEEAMLGRRTEMDTSHAEKKAAEAGKLVAAEKKLQEKIARLHSRLLEVKESYQLSPERIERAVGVALELAEKPPLQPVTECDNPNGSVYKVPLLTGSWDRATHGLPHPHTGVRRPITFDHTRAQGTDNVVLAHLQHKLVQMSLRLLREQVWAHDDRRKLHRVAIRTVSDGTVEEPAAIVWSRLVITGGTHQRLHEELTLAGGELKLRGFSRIRTLGKLEELLAEGRPHEPSERTFTMLCERFSESEESIRKAVEARSRERLEFLTNTLNRRREQEESDLNEVLDGLQEMIEGKLAPEQRDRQMEFWPDDQREQLRCDLEALQARLDRIPEEREKEIAAIRRRYEAPIDRTFPVAIEFIVPESLAEGR